MTIQEFDECNHTIKSERTGELCHVRPRPFAMKIKDGGYKSVSANSGHIIDGSPKTLGSWAERNTKRLGSKIQDDERAIRARRLEERRKAFEKRHGNKPGVSFGEPPESTPEVPWRDGPPDLSLAKIKTREQMDKWCYEGKKPL